MSKHVKRFHIAGNKYVTTTTTTTTTTTITVIMNKKICHKTQHRTSYHTELHVLVRLNHNQALRFTIIKKK